MNLIEPETDHLTVAGYTEDHWDYPKRCADVETALVSTRERIEEWDAEDDPHGWWHERPSLIALYNEVVRLRADLAELARSRELDDIERTELEDLERARRDE